MSQATRTWTTQIQAPDEFINANHRRHRIATATRIRNWRWAGQVYARKASFPKLTGQARIQAKLHFTDARRRDDHNYFATIKAIIDGMVGDYGLLPDDSAAHLIGVEISRGEPVPRKQFGPCGAVTITVIEVTP